MNLYFRLLLGIIRARFLPPIAVGDTIERVFRVWPNDLDINRHMNNGRYMTINDLMIVEFFLRSGFYRALLRNRWYPVIGGCVISFRRELKPFQRYRVRYRIESADAFWNYMRFDFLAMDGKVIASGYTKGAAKSRTGLVPNAQSYGAMDLPFQPQPLGPAIEGWIASEAALMRAAPAPAPAAA